ncbi:MAG: arginine--tRNA ligase [Endomicrobium sp.]|jgi:arginyl-tRNA synthetase|nr:arginine--tRNA ligase [Endomicrobium sp.]
MIKQRITKSLKNLISKYLKTLKITGDLCFCIETPPKNINADFSFNCAMLIAKKINVNPKIIATEIIDLITKNIPELIESASMAGPGFINLIVKNQIFYEELEIILKKKDKYGKFSKNNKEKIIIEFVSANPTGPLHIGHGRGAAIGDSLARILKYLGYNVTKEYYLNDFGNQIFILAKSVEIRYRQLKGEKIELSKNHYQGKYIINIAKNLINGCKDFNKIDFKHEAVKYILQTIKNDLKNFDVKFDNWFSEKNIATTKDKNDKTEIDKVCEYLLLKDNAYKKDGAMWLASSKFGDEKDRVLKRSDGRYTYLASDVAYHKNKFKRGFSRLINFWGADHHGYIPRIKACVQMLGFDEKALNIILYQLVSFIKYNNHISQSSTMSTRAGEFVTLKEVLKEVGKDTCRFFFLLRAPNSQLEFDLELAKKKSVKNPVFYVQYVNARCKSIIKESNNRNNLVKNIKNINFNLLNTEEERNLIKQLTTFYDTLRMSEKTMSPHYVALYLIELADKYHKFYEKCRVLSNDINLTSARLKLVECVMIIIKNGLNLIGVSAPDKM